jgi:signal transduction histidine kinase
LERARHPGVTERLLAAFGVVVLLGAVTLFVHYGGTRKRDAAFAAVHRALERQARLLDVTTRVRDRHRQVELLTQVVGLEGTPPDSAERAATLDAIDSIPALLATIDAAADAAAADSLLTLRTNTLRLAQSWRAFYGLQWTDPTAALSELALKAEPLAYQLLTRDFPAALVREQASVQRATLDFQRVGRASARASAATFIASTALAGLLVVVALRGLVRSIHALQTGAERIGEGALDHRIPIVGRDEVGQVSASFNEMAARLQAARAQVERRTTQLAETLERLRHANETMIQQEKLSALGGMLAGLAHELNNPLASVLASAQLLERELDARRDPRLARVADELVKPIAREALRAADLVRNLLQFARRSDVEIQAVDLAGALRFAAGLRAHAFTVANLHLVLDLTPGVSVRADPTRLQQVFLNLINNAYDALHDVSGSSLWIVTAAPTGDVVTVRFDDDGPGIKDPDRVFEPFYTTKPVGAGTGLGLALVHRFVQEFGGEVTASNRPEGGARFELRLRVATAAAALDAATAPTAPRSEPLRLGGRPHVLVVDDEATLLTLQQRVLEELGCDVTTAPSAVVAQAVLQDRSFDLVVSDVKMPGEIDGIGLFEWLTRERPEVAERFVFVTGALEDQALQARLVSEGHRLILKPFDVDRYAERIHELLTAMSGPRP